jgi:non-specific serine/threonine protein kinase
MLSWAELMAGRVEDSHATWQEAWSITESTHSPYLSTMALSFGAAAARDLGDTTRALELSQQGIELATQHQLLFWLALAHMQHGSANCLGGKVADGLSEIEKGLGLFRLTGASHPLAYYLCYLADACHRAGAVAKGLAAVEEGLSLSSKTVDRNCTPELLRIKAELLILEGDTQLAEQTLRESLELARMDGSGLWELRAATSLARLLEGRGDLALPHHFAVRGREPASVAD